MIKIKGHICLKTSGVIFLIYGAALLLAVALSLFSAEAMEEFGLLARLNSPVPLLSVALCVLIPLLYLLAGLFGLLRADRPRRAKPCLWLGLPIFVLTVVDIVYALLTGGTPGVAEIGSHIFDLLVPVLYLAGAWRNLHHTDPTSPADKPEL